MVYYMSSPLVYSVLFLGTSFNKVVLLADNLDSLEQSYKDGVDSMETSYCIFYIEMKSLKPNLRGRQCHL